MDIHRYDIQISRHALLRALERHITPDMVEASIKGGKIQRFGKHGAKLIKPYKDFTVICVGEIKGLAIKIMTIEKGE